MSAVLVGRGWENKEKLLHFKKEEWCFLKVTSFWPLRCGMQVEPFTNSRRIIMCHSAFLGTLSVDKKSGIQQCNISGGKKISLFIHLLDLMIMPLTSIEVECTELRRQIKERLLRFVGYKEVKKIDRLNTFIPFSLSWIYFKWHTLWHREWLFMDIDRKSYNTFRIWSCR